MTPVVLKRPSVAVPAIAILALAGAGLASTLGHVAGVPEYGLRGLLQTQLLGGMSLTSTLLIAAVLFVSGVVSGLAGFAFSAVAACVLWLLPPLQAVPLVMLLSACNQLLSIGKLRREMTIRSTGEREGALTYIVGGFAGVPVGVALLRGLPAHWFAAGLGLFLVVYGALMLALPARCRIAMSGRRAAAAVGALGGVVGGFSGFGASVLVVYLGLRGANKATTRGITQPYILAMQLVALCDLAITDPTIFGAAFWLLWAVTLPAVLLGTTSGVALYRRLSDGNFRLAVLILLIVSGASLMAKAVI